MKKIISILLISLFSVIYAFAQNSNGYEESKPHFGIKFQKTVESIRIEDKYYANAVVYLKSNTPDYQFVTKGSVKVTVTVNDEVVYKKKMKDSYLYIFPSGKISVGKGNFSKLCLRRFSDNKYRGVIDEKEGAF